MAKLDKMSEVESRPRRKSSRAKSPGPNTPNKYAQEVEEEAVGGTGKSERMCTGVLPTDSCVVM